jgi:translation initiation factor 3 subunit G
MAMSGAWADDEPLTSATGAFEDIDAQGNKVITTIIEKNGKQYKQKRTVKKRTRTRVVNKRAEERKRNWVPFGKAIENDSGVTVLQEEIKFDIRGLGPDAHEKIREIEGDITRMLIGDGKWMRKGARTGGLAAADMMNDGGPSTPMGMGGDDKPGRSGNAPGVYVAPGRGKGGEAGPGGPGGRDRYGDEAYTLRVTNLSESVTEDNLKTLFNRFGSLQRVFLVKDKTTKVSKGFAFVSYLHRTDAEKAMSKVHGMGHDHLILQVEWARPQAK